MTSPADRKAELISYYRALDEDADTRQHFRHHDDEGGLWYFEAVSLGPELIVVKQAEITPDGALHRYSWRHLEDQHGFLTDMALRPGADPVEPISHEQFARVWAQAPVTD